jgi:hypothetical protein
VSAQKKEFSMTRSNRLWAWGLGAVSMLLYLAIAVRWSGMF